jgi:hypothetical protein
MYFGFAFPLFVVTDEGCTLSLAAPILNAAWVEASVEQFGPQAENPPQMVGFLLNVPIEKL